MAVSRLTSHEDLLPTLLSEAFACTNPIRDYSTGELLLPSNNDSKSSDARGLLMETWTDRAILYDKHLYLIDPFGDIDVVDQNYDPVDNHELPPDVLTHAIEQMSRFLKSK